MKKIGVLSAIIALLFCYGCSTKPPVPDVSGIRFPWEVQRFERDLFAIDTLQLDSSLQRLTRNYPGFTQDFLYNILGTTPERVPQELPRFIQSYRDWSRQVPADEVLEPQLKLVKQGCAFFNYYFPSYALPNKLITFIGPVNGFGNILTPDALAVGLQVYMGKDFPWYGTAEVQQLYPPYIARRFEPVYLPVNCMKNLIDDLYPDPTMGQPLVEQMIESGKRVYLLQLLLPSVSDTLITGYTAAQLKACYASEQGIWSFFVQNDLLFSKEVSLVRDYLGEAPGTPALGEKAPGNIGQFCGWRIVQQWMKKNAKVTPAQLLRTPAATIFQQAKYKP